tara:strand:+ start:1910 stop:2944 length:1035 start_codon:yes stop_codon:yes gene_type:complete
MDNNSIRQAVMIEPGKIEMRKVAPPKIKNDEVLLRIKHIGICGSDIHVNHGLHPFTSYPVIQGHEFSGIIEEVGSEINNLYPGMNVTGRPQIVCGDCGPCKRDDYNICDELKVEGFQAPGVAQDLFSTSSEKIIPLPNSLSLEQGALVEPVSVAVHAAKKAGDLKGKHITIFGAGPIGNLIGQVCQSSGAKKVLIRDISDFRLSIAKACGLENISNARNESMADAKLRIFGNDSYSIAYEAVGIEPTMKDGIETIEKGGKLIIVGVFGEKPKIDMALVGDRELNLIGSLMYKHQDFEDAVRLIELGEIILSPLITKHFPLEKYEDAYSFIEEQGDRSLKVIIDL